MNPEFFWEFFSKILGKIFCTPPYIWIFYTKNQNRIFSKFDADFRTISQFVHKCQFGTLCPDALHGSAGGQALPILGALVERL